MTRDSRVLHLLSSVLDNYPLDQTTNLLCLEEQCRLFHSLVSIHCQTNSSFTSCNIYRFVTLARFRRCSKPIDALIVAHSDRLPQTPVQLCIDATTNRIEWRRHVLFDNNDRHFLTDFADSFRRLVLDSSSRLHKRCCYIGEWRSASERTTIDDESTTMNASRVVDNHLRRRQLYAQSIRFWSSDRSTIDITTATCRRRLFVDMSAIIDHNRRTFVRVIELMFYGIRIDDSVDIVDFIVGKRHRFPHLVTLLNVECKLDCRQLIRLLDLRPTIARLVVDCRLRCDVTIDRCADQLMNKIIENINNFKHFHLISPTYVGVSLSTLCRFIHKWQTTPLPALDYRPPNQYSGRVFYVIQLAASDNDEYTFVDFEAECRRIDIRYWRCYPTSKHDDNARAIEVRNDVDRALSMYINWYPTPPYRCWGISVQTNCLAKARAQLKFNND